MATNISFESIKSSIPQLASQESYFIGNLFGRFVNFIQSIPTYMKNDIRVTLAAFSTANVVIVAAASKITKTALNKLSFCSQLSNQDTITGKGLAALYSALRFMAVIIFSQN